MRHTAKILKNFLPQVFIGKFIRDEVVTFLGPMKWLDSNVSIKFPTNKNG